MLQSTLAPVLAQRVMAQPVVEGRQLEGFEEPKAAGGAHEKTENGGGESVGGESTAKKKLKKKKKAKAPATLAVTADEEETRTKERSFLPLSRFPPPQCCPPDRCTGDTPDHFVWPELDGLLYETCLAGFKCASSFVP